MAKEEEGKAEIAEKKAQEKREKEAKEAGYALRDAEEKDEKEFREWQNEKKEKGKGKPENLVCPKCGTIWDAVKKAWQEVKAEGWMAGFFRR